MKPDANPRPTRSRSSRKKPVAADAADAPSPAAVTAAEAEAETVVEPTGDGKNVNPLESSVSLAVGVLVLVAALFPRTIKQLLFLGIGGGLVYRGMTRQCGVYAALGIDTAKEPLLKQINEKYLSAPGDA